MNAKTSTALMLMLAVLASGCVEKKPVELTTMATLIPTEPTTTTTEATTTTTTTSTTTTSTTLPPLTTTTTTTSTTTVSTPTTIVKAKCYMNSDCGPDVIKYVCKYEHNEDDPEGNATERVYRVKYTQLCLDPGTAISRCISRMYESPWDSCTEDEYCVPGQPWCKLKST